MLPLQQPLAKINTLLVVLLLCVNKTYIPSIIVAEPATI
nr:MAG TPA: hypothetical protein [Caudoviricetes sp.]